MRQDNHNFFVLPKLYGYHVWIWAEGTDGGSRWRRQVNSLWVPAPGGRLSPSELLRGLARELERPYLERSRPPTA